MADNHFPPRIRCRLGELVVGDFSRPYTEPHYLPTKEPQVSGRGAVELVVIAPRGGIANAQRAASYIDAVWDRLWLEWERILFDCVPVVERVVDRWWCGSANCPLDRVHAMLTAAPIDLVKLNLDGPHEVLLNGNDVVSGRDIIIYLSGSLQPVGAQLDG